jgi:hypothetical protein
MLKAASKLKIMLKAMIINKIILKAIDKAK